MKIFAYAASGYNGHLIAVEVDIRRGIPGLDIVGLPDSAVRESGDRVRIALQRSGFEFPAKRILVNLAPAGLKKVGASYDLPIAAGILAASSQIPNPAEYDVLCAGELQLDGTVRSVSGILPAAAAALNAGVTRFIVPKANREEAAALPGGRTVGISKIGDLTPLLEGEWPDSPGGAEESANALAANGGEVDMADLKGQPILKRALEISACGAHHLLIFGPPGSGKTLGARTLPGILPDLIPEKSLEVTRIWSQAGLTDDCTGLMRRPPFREPHHSSSLEGLLGGGNAEKPGEVSLAHGGILFLDEATEFVSRALQSLREPLESGKVHLARAHQRWWYPSEFLLMMAMNPCPCGNLGKEDASCFCSVSEIRRYWGRIGGALMDRIDIRVPITPVSPETLLALPQERSEVIRKRVEKAREAQYRRYESESWSLNASLPAGELSRYAPLDKVPAETFTRAVRMLGLSSRAAHGVLRVARTLADMAGRAMIKEEDILEAAQHRRYGGRDLFWLTL